MSNISEAQKLRAKIYLEDELTAKYYVETWINGNKSHVINHLSNLFKSKNYSDKMDYNEILQEFIAYDSRLAIRIIDKVIYHEYKYH